MKKLTVGLFCFTCCEGCGFTVLFIDKILELLNQIDLQYFSLLKEKNKEAKFDLAFIEGAITSKREIEKLKKIRAKSKFVVALGACACHGGIPSMRNLVESEALEKYVYNQEMLDDSIAATGIDKHIKVDYYMYGCPIIKPEFVHFLKSFIEGKIIKEFKGTVCDECPRRGGECYLREKKVCLGALTHGGCNALCIRENIACTLCRGPISKEGIATEIKLFKSWDLEEKDIINKIHRFAG